MISKEKVDLNLAIKLETWLKDHGCKFASDGFPLIPDDCYCEDEPEYIAPWHHRSYYPKEKTSICFCMPDDLLYPRFAEIFQNIEELRKYHSVCWMDISVSKNMNRETQRFNMLMNALYAAVLAYSGIKVIPSIRCGDEATICFLEKYKSAPLMFLGIHGCSRATDLAGYDEYITRCEFIILYPKRLLLYGKPQKKEIEVLDDIGFSYRIYDDFRKLYKSGRQLGC